MSVSKPAPTFERAACPMCKTNKHVVTFHDEGGWVTACDNCYDVDSDTSRTIIMRSPTAEEAVAEWNSLAASHRAKGCKGNEACGGTPVRETCQRCGASYHACGNHADAAKRSLRSHMGLYHAGQRKSASRCDECGGRMIPHELCANDPGCHSGLVECKKCQRVQS